VRLINVAELDIPVLHSKAEWESTTVSDAVRAAQEVILWADHLLLIHPLWLGSMPAALKAFLEQVFRPGFAVDTTAGGWKKKLGGRSARVIVTMGMPALIYRYFFLAHGLKSMVRNVLKFSGIGPVRTTVIGTVEGKYNGIRSKWLPLMSRYGMHGA
jgi:putative NADPH-quinone reductase